MPSLSIPWVIGTLSLEPFQHPTLTQLRNFINWSKLGSGGARCWKCEPNLLGDAAVTVLGRLLPITRNPRIPKLNHVQIVIDELMHISNSSDSIGLVHIRFIFWPQLAFLFFWS
jgi:hypothetical protein